MWLNPFLQQAWNQLADWKNNNFGLKFLFQTSTAILFLGPNIWNQFHYVFSLSHPSIAETSGFVGKVTFWKIAPASEETENAGGNLAVKAALSKAKHGASLHNDSLMAEYFQWL